MPLCQNVTPPVSPPPKKKITGALNHTNPGPRGPRDDAGEALGRTADFLQGRHPPQRQLLRHVHSKHLSLEARPSRAGSKPHTRQAGSAQPGVPPGTAPPRRPAPRRSRSAAPWRPRCPRVRRHAGPRPRAAAMAGPGPARKKGENKLVEVRLTEA